MNRVAILFFLYGAFRVSNATYYASPDSFKWSKSYTLKAVLTVPAANLSEPYQVWYGDITGDAMLDGDSGRSRVDFYDGMDKLYRQWDDILEAYTYYKIHPETTNKFTNKDVCHEVSANDYGTRMYALNSYLPVKRWTYLHTESVNNIDAKKFVYEYPVTLENVSAKVIYSVWVKFKKPSEGGTAIPVRYVYELKAGDKCLDNFRHDYSFFDDSKPEESFVQKPLGMQCKIIPDSSFHAPIDPLVEFVEPSLEHSRLEKAFDRFKEKHNKMYTNEEHFKRMNIFKNNLRYINSLNRQHKSFSLAVNHFADLTDNEISTFLGTEIPAKEVEEYEASGDDDNDGEDVDSLGSEKSSFDWRDYGAVTSVKDQTALCGSCYAFTTAAAIESSAYVSRGCTDLDEVSEQALIDCTWGGNFGCGGGSYEYTLVWVRDHGIALKTEYGPYLALEGRCHIRNMTKLVLINDFAVLEKKKHLIKDTLRKNGPLLAAINSDLKSFTFYSTGVYNDPKCRSEPDYRTHGVTIVGYGKEAGEMYWIIKNSFGPEWGEGGYMRLAMKFNVCGLKNFVNTVFFRKNKSALCKPLK